MEQITLLDNKYILVALLLGVLQMLRVGFVLEHKQETYELPLLIFISTERLWRMGESQAGAAS